MTVRGGLGRGLGALIPSGASVLEELPTSVIEPNPRQPRRSFDEESLETLAASIRQVGVLQPVVVRPAHAGRYQLVLGERRWRAAQRAGLATIPSLVIETDERGAIERALVENVHREDLNPIETAASYQQLIEEGGLTHEELAERLGLSRPAVTNSLRLLELPPAVQRLVLQGRLSAGHGRALLGLAGHPMLERIAQRVATESMTVRQTEELVRLRRIGADDPAPRRGEDPDAAREVAHRISNALGTRVKVTTGRRRGRILIDFRTWEQLEQLAARIIGGGAGPQAEGSDGAADHPTEPDGAEGLADGEPAEPQQPVAAREEVASSYEENGGAASSHEMWLGSA
jgi:ParB family chromosome partitioning protein